MLQEDPYFSSPYTFFGPHHPNDDECEELEDDFPFSKNWNLSHETDFTKNNPVRIGVFLHWYEMEE